MAGRFGGAWHGARVCVGSVPHGLVRTGAMCEKLLFGLWSQAKKRGFGDGRIDPSTKGEEM